MVVCLSKLLLGNKELVNTPLLERVQLPLKISNPVKWPMEIRQE